MKNYCLISIQWIAIILQFKVIIGELYTSSSYPGVYTYDNPQIIEGARQIENFYTTVKNGIDHQCIETCYPIYSELVARPSPPALPQLKPELSLAPIKEVSICDELCIILPEAPECQICTSSLPNEISILPPMPSLPSLPTSPPQPQLPPIPVSPLLPKLPPTPSIPPLPPIPPLPSLPPPIIVKEPLPTIEIPEPTLFVSPPIPPKPQIITPSVDETLLPSPPPSPEILDLVASDIIEIDICMEYCLKYPYDSQCLSCIPEQSEIITAEIPLLCDWCLDHPDYFECHICEDYSICDDYYCQQYPNAPECFKCFVDVSELEPSIPELPILQIPELPIVPPQIPIIPEIFPKLPSVPISPDTSEINVPFWPPTQNICQEYCVFIPNAPECSHCYNNIEMEPEGLHQTVYECCYGDYCLPLPATGYCPIICYEPCAASDATATTGNCNGNVNCFNPNCPNKCDEIEMVNERYRLQFMIWLKNKLTEIKTKYMKMIEECIQRTAALYDIELKSIEGEAETGYAVEFQRELLQNSN